MKGKINLDKAKQYADKSGDEECQAGIMRGLGDYHFTLNELQTPGIPIWKAMPYT